MRFAEKWSSSLWPTKIHWQNIPTMQLLSNMFGAFWSSVYPQTVWKCKTIQYIIKVISYMKIKYEKRKSCVNIRTNLRTDKWWYSCQKSCDTFICLFFVMITVHLQLHLVHRQAEEDIYLVMLQSFPLRKRYLHFLEYEDNRLLLLENTFNYN